MAFSIDARAQILANAMALYPEHVEAHILKHGYAALDASKVFDVILVTDGSTDLHGHHVPANAQHDFPGSITKTWAQLVVRDVNNPARMIVLKQSCSVFLWIEALERLLKAIMADMVHAG